VCVLRGKDWLFKYNYIFRCFRKIAKSDCWLHACLPSVRPSVHIELGSNPSDFHEIWHCKAFRKSAVHIPVWLKPDENKAYLHEYLSTLIIISRSLLLRIRGASIKRNYEENQNTHFMFNPLNTEWNPICHLLALLAAHHILHVSRIRVNNEFQKFCRLWDNVEKCGRSRQGTNDNIIRCMRFGCWIPKATNTHSEYLILISFPQQQWFLKSALIWHLLGTLPVLLKNWISQRFQVSVWEDR
jgi:hypothetical protein